MFFLTLNSPRWGTQVPGYYILPNIWALNIEIASCHPSWYNSEVSKIKVMFALEQAMKAQRKSRGTGLLFL